MAFRLVDPRDPLRARVEDAVALVYWRGYGATIESFPHHLVASLDDDGNPTSAAGLRFAGTSFFSECYLDAPIEEVLSRTSGTRVFRSQIVEITTLAAIKPGTSLELVRHIIGFARESQMTWAFFTATERLRALLRRAVVPAMDLVPAEPHRVPDASRWGSYYHTQPRVTAISEAMAPAFNSSLRTSDLAVHG